MHQGDISKWTDIENCQNLLFFSQLVQELLFDYSIPSNRVSTLNSHFLVLDALSAINSIDKNGVPEGTLKPIMEELYYELSKDVIFESEEPLEYFVKYREGQIYSHVKPKDLNYKELRNCAQAIQTVFFQNNSYYIQLKDEIIKTVEDNEVQDQQKLFRLTKSLLTELINSGYSSKFIYFTMNRLFWNPVKCVENSMLITEFFDSFDFKDKEYTIIFKVKWVKMQPFICQIDNLEFSSYIEEQYLDRIDTEFCTLKNNEKFISMKMHSFDPYGAANSAISLIEDNVAVFRLFNHNYRYDIETANYRVLDEERCYYRGKRIKAVQHKKTPKETEIVESMNVAETAIVGMAKKGHINDFITILNAVKYHAHSLDSKAEENQLLDLWAIFESVLDVSNKHTSDRIQQVCSYLVPILKHRYIYSLFCQLADDIKCFDEEWFKDFVKTEKEEEIVKKIAEFTLLDEYESDRKDFIDKCKSFPLLMERIHYYNSILNNKEALYQYVEKHGMRVQWQIMRIYRNRNLIIHNAEKMPYLRLLIENLHSYVDDFLNHVIHEFSNNRDLMTMSQELFIKECKWRSEYSRKKDKLTKNDIVKMLQL